MSRLPAQPGLLLFGGSFNPPHLSHRRILEAALTHLEADRALLLPCGDHPLKDELAPASQRLEMCRLAFGDLPQVRIDARETRRTGPAFTVDTLRELSAELGPDHGPLFWLLGSDNLRILHKWHRHEEVLERARLVTFPRAGYPIDAAQLRAQGITEAQVQQLLADVLPCGDLPPDDRNASEVRAALAAGQRPPGLAPQVLQYIETHGVYRP